MNTRFLDAILGRVLLGFVLFAFNIDGVFYFGVGVLNPKTPVSETSPMPWLDSNDGSPSSFLPGEAFLGKNTYQIEGDCPYSCGRRLSRSHSIFAIECFGKVSSSSSFQTAVNRFVFEPSLGSVYLLRNFMTSRSFARCLFLLFLSLRN
jgi:hypothetical protein